MKRTDGDIVDEWADRILKALMQGGTRSALHSEVVRVLKEAQASIREELKCTK